MIFKTKKSTIESFRRHENALCKFFIQFTKIRFVISWSSQRIWIENQMKYIHRFQRENFKLTIFFWLAYFYEWFDDFFLNIRVSLRAMKILFIFAFFTNNWRFSLISRISTNVWRFYFFLLAYLDEQSVSKQKIWSNVNYFRKIQNEKSCCAKNNESSSLRVDREISCWKYAIVTKFVENDRVSFYSLIVSTSVNFTSFVTMKIKYNVKRMSRKQIT